MAGFLTDDFMLQSSAARTLYHRYAEQEPICDYHCHLSAKEIYEDKPFASLAELWLGGMSDGVLAGDHYKWRLMRAHGIEENFITGDAPPYERYLKWVETLQTAFGNPLYHWSHLELKRCFGINLPITVANAKTIWDHCQKILDTGAIRPRSLLKRFGVKALCTCDAPADDLSWPQKLAVDESLPFQVLPAFRPEVALHPEDPRFQNEIKALSQAVGMEIPTLDALKDALARRMDYFARHGCRLADQSFAAPDFSQRDTAAAETGFRKALAGELLTPMEFNSYQSELMLFLGREYHRHGFILMLHLGTARNNNSRMYQTLGPDAGFDSIGDGVPQKSLAALLDTLDAAGELPKTVLFTLNAGDYAKFLTLAGCFQQSYPGKIQFGAAWWFHDRKEGIENHLKLLAGMSLLDNCIGMLTDSRSFLSFTRHEYFRRILCNLLGQWMDEGELPMDFDLVGGVVRNICYSNTMQYLGLPAEPQENTCGKFDVVFPALI